jgi:hypothetical protein
MKGRYEDGHKWWTKDCQDCPYRTEMRCYWGVWRKLLVKFLQNSIEHKPKACEYRYKLPPPGFRQKPEMKPQSPHLTGM